MFGCVLTGRLPGRVILDLDQKKLNLDNANCPVVYVLLPQGIFFSKICKKDAYMNSNFIEAYIRKNMEILVCLMGQYRQHIS